MSFPERCSWTRCYAIAALALCATLTVAHSAGVRDRTRPTYKTGATLTESQASDLTLTLTAATARPVQTWVRTAGDIDASNKIITAQVYPPEAELIRPGQRVRSFSLESKSSMYQGRVTRVAPQTDHVTVEVTLASTGYADGAHYLLEIVVERGTFLSVPNEALITEGDQQVVYVQKHPGHYEPQEVHTGLQGELYTQVLHGLEDGDEVVTLGSFFIDAEYKLKRSPDVADNAPNEHHHH